MVDKSSWDHLCKSIVEKGVKLVAVSKTKPVEDLLSLYYLGQRDFGENYVQELTQKQSELPKDVRWHFIGHLQGNKVKVIAPFIHLIHSVDSFSLLKEVNKQGIKYNRTIDVLLQIHIADEQTKFGLDKNELDALIAEYVASRSIFTNIRICGLMGMATNTEDENKIKNEFNTLKKYFDELSAKTFINEPYFSYCSMGMSSDYKIAIECGSNMVRIGSILFGRR